MGFIIRLARKILESVLSQLTQQFNVVQEQALAPVRAIIQQVVGGAWTGDGATAFTEELNSLMVPGVGRIGEAITSKIGKLNSARDRIDQADNEIRNLISSRIEDAFNFYN
jgi:uncharacterized protein YukE